MSDNKYTPEPWRTDAECGFPQDIHDSKGNLFLRCGSDFDNEIYGEANARRIVACVNRLAQFTTEQIEDFGYDLFAEDRPRLVEAQNEIHLLKKQRDELLAALEKCRKELSAWMRDHGDDIATQEAVADARAAIASVKGEQK